MDTRHRLVERDRTHLCIEQLKDPTDESGHPKARPDADWPIGL